MEVYNSTDTNNQALYTSPGLDDIKRGVQEKCHDAMWTLSQCYAHGSLGLKKSSKLARQYSNSAIKHGSKDAFMEQLRQYVAQDHASVEEGGSVIYRRTWRWLQEQEKSYGHIFILEYIGSIYHLGTPPVQQDGEKANLYIQSILERGGPGSFLEDYLENVIGNGEKELEAFTWLQCNQEILKHHPEFHKTMALYYHKGLGNIPKNSKLARYYIENHQKLGGTISLTLYLDITKETTAEKIDYLVTKYSEGTLSDEQLLSTLFGIFSELRKYIVDQSQNNLSQIIEILNGITHLSAANIFLGWFYWNNGETVKGYAYYVTAMEQGHRDARRIIGYLIEDGVIIESEYPRLLSYFEKRVHENPQDFEAHGYLAKILRDCGSWGFNEEVMQAMHDIEKPFPEGGWTWDDDDRAIRHCMIAAKGGNPFAVDLLDKLLRHGYIEGQQYDEVQDIVSTAHQQGIVNKFFALTYDELVNQTTCKSIFTPSFTPKINT